MSLYRCPECHNIYSNEEWDYTTAEVYGEDIEDIMPIDVEKYDHLFICPNCGEEIVGDNIEEV